MPRKKYILITLLLSMTLIALVGFAVPSLAVTENVGVLIHLAEQAETTKTVSRQEMVYHLQSTANKTQAPLLRYLQSKQADGQVNTIESYYVVNVIYAEMAPGLLKSIEKRTDVKEVYLNENIVLDTPIFQELTAAVNQELPWNLERVNAELVWDEYGLDGAGVVIGFIDTGVDWEHPALKYSWRGHEESDPDYNWYDPVHHRPMPDDQHGHGTQVAGIALGIDPESGIRTGVAPGARWIAARGLNDQGVGSKRSLLAAGQFMLAPTDADGKNPDPDQAPRIIVNSWGSDVIDDDWYHQMVQNWRSASILPVFAAGNSGPKEKTITNPAVYPEAIAVGSLDSSNALSVFSSRGPGIKGEKIKPDLVAPGRSILSPIPGGYTYGSGTSMAAPHVAGAAALLLSKDDSLGVDRLQEILIQTARPLSSDDYPESPNYGFGYGLLDAASAVDFITPRHTLSISVKGQGTTDPAPEQHTYPRGQQVTLTAIPEAGWSFKKWLVNEAEHPEPETMLVMDEDKAATAYFQYFDYDTLPKELDNLFIVGDSGISIDFWFNNPPAARAKINESLASVDGFHEVFVNFTDAGQFFVLSTRQDAAADDVQYILSRLKGFWDEEGNWLDW